jgi:hypothetical protein
MVIRYRTEQEKAELMAMNMKVIPFVPILIPKETRLTRREFLTIYHFHKYGIPNSNQYTRELLKKYQHWKDTTQSIRDTAPTFAPKI